MESSFFSHLWSEYGIICGRWIFLWVRMMKKRVWCLLICCLFLLPLGAEAVDLVSLEINEEIVPGPRVTTLTVTGTLSNGIKQQVKEGLVWETSDPKIAQVEYGRLYFSGVGGAVTSSVSKGQVSGHKTVLVKPWPETMVIENRLVYSEKPYRLLVKGRFSDGERRYFGPEEKVLWSSSNPWVAWVNQQGIVTFTGEPGEVTIRAVCGSLSDYWRTTVSEGEVPTAWRTGIEIKETEITYRAKPQQLTLLTLYSDGSKEEVEAEIADWSSSNPEVVKVNSLGVISFSGEPGVAVIKAVVGGFTTERIVKVERFLKEISLNQSLRYVPEWDGVPLSLSVTAIYNDGVELIQNTDLVWETNNEAVAGIDEKGVLTFTGQPGKVAIRVSGRGEEGKIVEDVCEVEVPDIEKAEPRRLYIEHNPLILSEPFAPRVFCIDDQGKRREVTEQVEWRSLNPEVASIYQNKIYFSPNPGQINIMASYQGLTDTLSGYNSPLGSKHLCQIRIREHYLPFSFQPVKLTAWGLYSDGSAGELNGQLRWSASNPLVAAINQAGEVNFNGRIGKTVITVQGYGWRDFLEIEVLPEDLQPQVEKLIIEGSLTQGYNQLAVIAFFNDGTSKEVTQEAVWNTSNQNKAIVTEEGTVMFLGKFAPVVITANYGGKSAKISWP